MMNKKDNLNKMTYRNSFVFYFCKSLITHKLKHHIY
jgi:hypothetical protein